MKVLIPIDGSECGRSTLEWATGFLDKTSAQIYLLHVIAIPQTSYITPEIPMTEYDVKDAIALLDEVRILLENKGFVVEEAQYILGDPARAICQYADDKEIEQIIIGSHGHQGLAEFLMGSVSKDVFKRAKQPVLLINNGKKSSIALSHPEQVALYQVE